MPKTLPNLPFVVFLNCCGESEATKREREAAHAERLARIEIDQSDRISSRSELTDTHIRAERSAPDRQALDDVLSAARRIADARMSVLALCDNAEAQARVGLLSRRMPQHTRSNGRISKSWLCVGMRMPVTSNFGTLRTKTNNP